MRQGKWKLLRRHGASEPGQEAELNYLARNVGETMNLAKVLPQKVSDLLGLMASRHVPNDRCALVPLPKANQKRKCVSKG